VLVLNPLLYQVAYEVGLEYEDFVIKASKRKKEAQKSPSSRAFK